MLVDRLEDVGVGDVQSGEGGPRPLQGAVDRGKRRGGEGANGSRKPKGHPGPTIISGLPRPSDKVTNPRQFSRIAEQSELGSEMSKSEQVLELARRMGVVLVEESVANSTTPPTTCSPRRTRLLTPTTDSLRRSAQVPGYGLVSEIPLPDGKGP